MSQAAAPHPLLRCASSLALCSRACKNGAGECPASARDYGYCGHNLCMLTKKRKYDCGYGEGCGGQSPISLELYNLPALLLLRLLAVGQDAPDAEEHGIWCVSRLNDPRIECLCEFLGGQQTSSNVDVAELLRCARECLSMSSPTGATRAGRRGSSRHVRGRV